MGLYNTLANCLDIDINRITLINKQLRGNCGTPYKKCRVNRSFTPSKAKRTKKRRNVVKRKHK